MKRTVVVGTERFLHEVPARSIVISLSQLRFSRVFRRIFSVAQTCDRLLSPNCRPTFVQLREERFFSTRFPEANTLLVADLT